MINFREALTRGNRRFLIFAMLELLAANRKTSNFLSPVSALDCTAANRHNGEDMNIAEYRVNEPANSDQEAAYPVRFTRLNLEFCSERKLF